MAMMAELAAYTTVLMVVHARGEQWSSGVLWVPRRRYALDVNKKMFTERDLEYFERCIGPVLPTCEALGIPLISGRLGQVVEGGGKRRIFAIGNYINQRLLNPVHDWLMAVLRLIPMDGTFAQEKPLDRLVGSRECYSFDLKAATDRWPLVFLFEVMCYLFDRSWASAVVNTALAYNIFDVPWTKSKTPVSFVAGQPLGYLSFLSEP